MRKILLFLLLFIPAFSISQNDNARWKEESSRVLIIKDSWGIPHIYGKSDADAVFGLIYAECQENFERVERNYLEVMGRLAEVDGPGKLYDDLLMQLIYDSSDAKKDYERSPAWFKKLLDAASDGINYYLYLHPNIKSHVLRHFEPWFALMYTDGSISATQTGGLKPEDIRAMYPLNNQAITLTGFNKDIESCGSNGFALAPFRTESGHSILYINPHVSFYFRMEAQVGSEEGLNAYGAATWGQFFIYQGFNEHCGWMHTSSYADVADLFEEKIIKKGDSYFNQYDEKFFPVRTKKMVLRFMDRNGLSSVPLTVYYTNHGPVVGMRNGKWLSLKEHNRSYSALLQSWLRTKAKGFEDFKKTMELLSDNSNNTVFADDKGNIAYWHGNFMPVRDPRFNYDLPVDGSISATDWKGLHKLDEIIHVYNPSSGFIQNCNSTPFAASGLSSPNKKDYPAYMSRDAQNGRALNALRLFDNGNKFDLDKIIKAGYDRYLSIFSILIPGLLESFNQLEDSDSIKGKTAAAIQMLQQWDFYSSEKSIPTTVAVEWGNLMMGKIPKLREETKINDPIELYHLLAKKTPPREQIELLRIALTQLETKYASWQIPWGEINRYQRLTGRLMEKFSDDSVSIPVGLASARWGCLPAFESHSLNGTRRNYGLSGNSFIAAVEFGTRVRARAISTGGESFDPESKHFTDQAGFFVSGQLRDVFFYRDDVLSHQEKRYHPGEE